jgi:outer membrane protein assembly factor BamB
VLTIPDPEHAAGGETEVEITDLDSGKVSGRSTRGRPSFRARAWMSLAVIAGLALLVVAVLVNVSHLPKAGRMTAPPVHINYPVSLSVVDGICYAIAPNGVVTALRVSDGSLLWRHAGGKTGEESAIVVDGVVYLTPLLPPGSNDPTVTVEALHASDGSPLWSRTLPTDAPASFQLTVVNRVVYVLSAVERIDALRASDGSLLWHYTSRTPFDSLLPVVDGVIYAGTQDGHLYALRASDGFLLWAYTSLNPPQSFSTFVADGMVYLSLQSGGMDVLRADVGVFLWRYTPRVPALQLSPQPLVADGVVYALTQDGHLYALRASDGFTVWSVALHATDLLPPLIGTGGVIFVGAYDGSIDALRESSGSVLWRHQDGSIDALRANSGSLRWHRAMNS